MALLNRRCLLKLRQSLEPLGRRRIRQQLRALALVLGSEVPRDRTGFVDDQTVVVLFLTSSASSNTRIEKGRNTHDPRNLTKRCNFLPLLRPVLAREDVERHTRVLHAQLLQHELNERRRRRQRGSVNRDGHVSCSIGCCGDLEVGVGSVEQVARKD